MTPEEIEEKSKKVKFLISTIEGRCSKFGRKCQDGVKVEVVVSKLEKEKDDLKREIIALNKDQSMYRKKMLS